MHQFTCAEMLSHGLLSVLKQAGALAHWQKSGGFIITGMMEYTAGVSWTEE
jgi:hypothetical protein